MEAGGWRLEARGWRLEAGGSLLEVGDEGPSATVVLGAFNRGGFGLRKRGRGAKWWIDIL